MFLKRLKLNENRTGHQVMQTKQAKIYISPKIIYMWHIKTLINFTKDKQNH